MPTFQSCILRKQSAGLPSLIPDVAVAHGMALTGGRFLSSLLRHCGQIFSFLSSKVEIQALCVYKACSRNSVWTNVWVSLLSCLTINVPVYLGRWIDASSSFILCPTTPEMLCGPLGRRWEFCQWPLVNFGLFPFSWCSLLWKECCSASERITYFPFLPLFMSWHWLALVFTDMGGLVTSFSLTTSYLQGKTKSWNANTMTEVLN